MALKTRYFICKCHVHLSQQYFLFQLFVLFPLLKATIFVLLCRRALKKIQQQFCENSPHHHGSHCQKESERDKKRERYCSITSSFLFLTSVAKEGEEVRIPQKKFCSKLRRHEETQSSSLKALWR